MIVWLPGHHRRRERRAVPDGRVQDPQAPKWRHVRGLRDERPGGAEGRARSKCVRQGCRQLLEAESIDAVIIETPGSFAATSRMAMGRRDGGAERGCPQEKPIAHAIEEGFGELTPCGGPATSCKWVCGAATQAGRRGEEDHGLGAAGGPVDDLLVVEHHKKALTARPLEGKLDSGRSLGPARAGNSIRAGYLSGHRITITAAAL